MAFSPELLNLSFSGCGLLCVYHAGVAAAIQEYAPNMLKNRILGASAGAIVGCVILSGVCMSKATATLLKIAGQARSRAGGPLHRDFDLIAVVRAELRDILPSNAYQLCSGRLIVSLTRWEDCENVLVSDFSSNEELIDAIICSSFIPFYCGDKPPTYRGVKYIDGGMSNNQPIFDAHTVTVSPFAGKSNICPTDTETRSIINIDFNGTSFRCSVKNVLRLKDIVWPKSNEEFAEICHHGFRDALRFLRKIGIIPCIPCLALRDMDKMIFGANNSTFDKTTLRVRKKTGVRRSRGLQGFSFKLECKLCGKECETSQDEEKHVRGLFPEILKKVFDETMAVEKSIFNYLSSWRIIRYVTTSFGIARFAFNVAITLVKRLIDYLEIERIPERVLLKMREVAFFVIAELERQQNGRDLSVSCIRTNSLVDKKNIRTSEMQRPIAKSGGKVKVLQKPVTAFVGKNLNKNCACDENGNIELIGPSKYDEYGAKKSSTTLATKAKFSRSSRRRKGTARYRWRISTENVIDAFYLANFIPKVYY